MTWTPSSPRGALDLVWQSPAENLADELAHRLLDAVRRRCVRRVFFDGLGALNHAFVLPDRFPVYLNAINNTLRALEATVVYTMERGELFMLADLHTDELSSMVDNVVVLHYGQAEDGIRRNLLIIKVRDSAFDAFPEPFHISDQGVQFGSPPNQGYCPQGGGRNRRRAADRAAGGGSPSPKGR